MIAHAAKADFSEIADERLPEFKMAFAGVLSTETSAVLLDPE